MWYETERQEGIEAGVSILVGADYDKIINLSENILSQDKSKTRLNVQNPYGDGKSAQKFEQIVKQFFKI